MDEYPWLESDDKSFDELFEPKKKGGRSPLFYLLLGVIITLLVIWLVRLVNNMNKESGEDELLRLREPGETCAADFQCKSGRCIGDENKWIYKDGRCQ